MVRLGKSIPKNWDTLRIAAMGWLQGSGSFMRLYFSNALLLYSKISLLLGCCFYSWCLYPTQELVSFNHYWAGVRSA